ncbi:MAG: YihY family inner membrane protein [Burkholderiaceae bacterium]|nr:YihY family inner membrane protein [Burkholderiaceae bacterium]
MNKLQAWTQDFMRDALRFPWKNTAWTLRERFKEDHLGLTASSLTFTTIISIVPLFTVALAIFSVFPMFAKMQTSLQQLLVDSLIPDNIARQVLSYLGQFASKASNIGWVGALAFLITALTMILTIDGKLNDIWRVRKTRHLARRIVVYWTLLTLGPLLLALSLSFSSYVVSSSKGWVTVMPSSVNALLNIVEFVVLACSMAAMYRFVPNTHVRWSHALLGGVFVALGIELAKRVLTWYLSQVPTYSAVYGAFATVPILLIWIYVAWVIVLLGAVVAAYLPSLQSGIARRGDTPGWNFQLALELLQKLSASQGTANATEKTTTESTEPTTAQTTGKSLEVLSQELRVDDLQLEEALQTLLSLDWIGRLDEEEARYVLLVDLASTPLAPLADRLLLPVRLSTQNMWKKSHWSAIYVADVLPK